MKIIDAAVFAYRLPFKQPLVLSGGTITERRGFLIKLTADTGAIGWGDVAPLQGFSDESFGTTEAILAELRESIIGVSTSIDVPVRPDQFMSGVFSLVRRRSVHCGLETAVLNLHAADTGRSLAELLSANPAPEISLNGLITFDDDVVQCARRVKRDGYGTIKLKVGRGGIADDVERIHLVRRELGDGIALRLDANLAWRFDDAVELAVRVADCEIEYIEEPLSDPARLSEFVSKTGLPVALDESTLYIDAGELRNHTYASAVVLKPTILGGLMRATSWATAARDLGMKVVISSSFESGVGIAALAQLAAAYCRPDVAAGLDTLDRFERDLIAEPIDTLGGRIVTSQAFLASRTVDISRLTRLTTNE